MLGNEKELHWKTKCHDQKKVLVVETESSSKAKFTSNGDRERERRNKRGCVPLLDFLFNHFINEEKFNLIYYTCTCAPWRKKASSAMNQSGSAAVVPGGGVMSLRHTDMLVTFAASR